MKDFKIIVIDINGKTNTEIENMLNQTGGDIECVSNQKVYLKVPVVIQKVQKKKTKKKQY